MYIINLVLQMDNITIDDQPFITIATQGRVANGKSLLIKSLTGVNPMKFQKEAERNMTLKLGYTNAKFYKCETCPKPYCYQINSENNKCNQCESKLKLVLHVSFVDSPGHTELQSTALSGAANMDYCILVVSADCTQDPETNEHYKVIKILDLESKSVIAHNKIDLVTKIQALEHYKLIRENFNIDTVIPMCAQFGFGLNRLIQYLVETIKNPINDTFLNKINLPLKVSIIRSFDVNKPGTLIKNLIGSVVGCTIKSGYIKIGDKIKIIPGICKANGTTQVLEAIVCSLQTENTQLQIAYPGGLIGIGLSIDPSLSKEDRLVGNFIVGINDTNNKIFKTLSIEYHKYSEEDIIEIKINDVLICMLGSIKRNIKIINIDSDNKILKFNSHSSMAGEIGDKIIITKLNKLQLYGKIIEIHD